MIEEDFLDRIFSELAKEGRPLTAIDSDGDERELMDTEQVREFTSENSDGT